jgi:5-methylcytosine-specific restriction endonuclease McrA
MLLHSVRVSSMTRTLLLNTTYEPLSVVSWQRAITLLFLGKVEVVRDYDDVIRSVSVTVRRPAVIRLLDMVRRRRVRLAFSRRNLFARDGHHCQYCRRRYPVNELTCDHVTPRARGGRTVWENVVACCVPCNRKKGGRTPEEAGMRLLRTPERPEALPLLYSLHGGLRAPPEPWREFLWAYGLEHQAVG